MKKLVLAAAVVAFAALPAGNAFAAASGAGCGLGTIIFEGQSGVLPQTLAATTNGSFANQLFGISTGTIGCQQDAVVMKEHERALYTEVNFEQLKQDMAAGHGEYLDALATLMGVEEADKAAFSVFIRERFAQLVDAADMTSDAFLANLDREMSADLTLSRYVA